MPRRGAGRGGSRRSWGFKLLFCSRRTLSPRRRYFAAGRGDWTPSDFDRLRPDRGEVLDCCLRCEDPDEYEDDEDEDDEDEEEEEEEDVLEELLVDPRSTERLEEM